MLPPSDEIYPSLSSRLTYLSFSSNRGAAGTLAASDARADSAGDRDESCACSLEGLGRLVLNAGFVLCGRDGGSRKAGRWCSAGGAAY